MNTKCEMQIDFEHEFTAGSPASREIIAALLPATIAGQDGYARKYREALSAAITDAGGTSVEVSIQGGATWLNNEWVGWDTDPQSTLTW